MNIHTERFNLLEELSVSDTVTKMTEDLCNQLISRIENDKPYVSKENNFKIKKGMFSFDTKCYLQNLKTLKVYYVIYHIKSEDEYNTIKEFGTFNCSSDYMRHNIKLSLAFVNGKPSVQFSPSVRHELNHIYEIDCGQTKNETFYDIVIDRYKNGEKWEKIVAWALYLSFKTEQDAFISQYYQYLKRLKPQPIGEPIINDENNPYNQFDKAFDNVDRLDIDEEELKNSFGITINKLYHLLNSADERLYKKMSNVWMKYRYDKEIERKDINPHRMNFLLDCYNNGINEETESVIW